MFQVTDYYECCRKVTVITMIIALISYIHFCFRKQTTCPYKLKLCNYNNNSSQRLLKNRHSYVNVYFLLHVFTHTIVHVSLFLCKILLDNNLK